MSRREAISEDLRKIGVGLVLASVIGIPFKVADLASVAVSGALILGALGLGLAFMVVGVMLVPDEVPQ